MRKKIKHKHKSESETGAVTIWLCICCALIVVMVAVGGITRLTESGLSIVDWRPVTGTLPPMNESEWEAEFAKYQTSPQFAHFSEEEPMRLREFKKIYFWEYLHRLLGRLVGVVYAIPMLIFVAARKVKGRVSIHLIIALLLGMGQGFMGWYMVKSGLVDKPAVSHYRLAAHLGLALFLFAYLLWINLTLNPFKTHRHTNYKSVKNLRNASIGFLVLLTIQIMYGAFVAGLDAGRMYPEYPMMGGKFFPSSGWSEHWQPMWTNLFENPATVQFVHRHLGMLLVVYFAVLWTISMTVRLMERQKFAFNFTLVVCVVQVILGLMTLTLGMPIKLAVLHQVTACALLGGTVTIVHSLIRPKTVTSRRS